MPKQTKLDEHAEIYQPRREQTEKEKLSEMNFQGKLAYLWEYYKIHAIATVTIIALVAYIVVQIVSPHVKPQLYAAILNSALDPTVLDQYKSDFSQHLALDPKRESVEFNSTFYMADNNELSATSQQVLSTYVATGEIDVIIAPESIFKEYTDNGYFAKLSDELPTDVYSSLTDSFLISDTSEDTEKNAYGIYLTNSDLFKNLTYNKEPYLLGILRNYTHKDNTVEFIKYLFKK
jgi:hypothetical protein